jgi:hypothetical protein
MAVTKKILKKAAVIIESSGGTYLAPTTLLGMTSFTPKRGYTMIEDGSIVGVAWKGLPAQGVGKIDGALEVQADALTLPPLLEAAVGANSTNVFTPPLTENTKSLSIALLDAVKTNKFAGIVCNNAKLSSQADADLKYSCDIISNIMDVRDGTSFPSTSVAPGTRFLHQHLSGANGYFRLGDQANALASGDNLTNVKSVELGWSWNFDFDQVNAQLALTPQSLAGDVTFKCQLAHHDTDAYAAWRDARTKLQIEYLYYAAAAAQLKIQVSNLIIESVEISSDDKAKIDLVFRVNRNGLGTDYENTSMSFVAPFKLTLTNS